MQNKLVICNGIVTQYSCSKEAKPFSFLIWHSLRVSERLPSSPEQRKLSRCLPHLAQSQCVWHTTPSPEEHGWVLGNETLMTLLSHIRCGSSQCWGDRWVRQGAVTYCQNASLLVSIYWVPWVAAYMKQGDNVVVSSHCTVFVHWTTSSKPRVALMMSPLHLWW